MLLHVVHTTWSLEQIRHFVHGQYSQPSNRQDISAFTGHLIAMGVELSELALGRNVSHSYLPFLGKVRNDLSKSELYLYLGPGVPSINTNALEALSYGPLSKALVDENEDDTIYILWKSPESIREISCLRETPLHVAAGWPRGVELLTHFARASAAAMINDRDCFGRTPLQHALLLRSLDAIEIVLNLGAHEDLENTRNLEIAGPDTNSLANTDSVIGLLSRKLAQQRKDLCELAMSSLAPSQISQYGIQSGHMVQNSAYEVAQAIKCCSVDLPKQYQTIQPGSLFHSAMTANLAESLFQVGFDQPNTLFSGYSPLMTINLFDVGRRRPHDGVLNIVAWHLQHGADLQLPLQNSSFVCDSSLASSDRPFRVAHRVAYYIGIGVTRHRKSISTCDYLPIYLDTWRIHASTIRSILADSMVDSCQCGCSSTFLRGCTTASIFNRGLIHPLEYNQHIRDSLFLPLDESDKILRDLWSKIMDLVTNTKSGSASEAPERGVVLNTLRVLTFERLGMKHTCCQYRRGHDFDMPVTEAILQNSYRVLDVMDRDEVAEIQDEDSELAETLDELMEEFECQFDQWGLSFSQFFEQYWRPRMDDVDGPWKRRCVYLEHYLGL